MKNAGIIFLLASFFLSGCSFQSQLMNHDPDSPNILDKKPKKKKVSKKARAAIASKEKSKAVKKKATTTKVAKVKKAKKAKKSRSYSYRVRGKQYRTLASAKGYNKRGTASWYGKPFHGRKTANGEIYNMYSMTAAHKRLPLSTKVKVTNLSNNRSVIVRVNDRGPFHGNRLIDLSYAAAKKLGFIHSGVARVKIQTLR